MKHTILLALAALALLATAAPAPQQYVYDLPAPAALAKESFAGQKVLRITNPSKQLLAKVSTIGFDVWGRGGNSIDVRVKDQAELKALETAAGGKLQSTIVIEDVQEYLDSAETAASAPAENFNAAAVDPYFNTFHRYGEVVNFVRSQCTAASDVCSFVPSIGKTVEGRDIVAVKIGKGPLQFYAEAQLHAREWGAGMTSQYLIWRLLQEKGTADIADLLKKVTIHIVPIVNADGFEFTHTGNRLWRKNRKRNSDGSIGVDLNRNFNYKWSGTTGSSRTPSSDTYRGPSVESEPETKAVVNYFKSLPNAVGGLDIHTFSQLILRPWGDTLANAPHETQLNAVGAEMKRLIYNVNRRSYTNQKGMDLYATIGTASDWFYTQRKSAGGRTVAPYGYTYELRPASGSSSGFVLPATEIVPQGAEIYPAFVYLVKTAVARPLTV